MSISLKQQILIALIVTGLLPLIVLSFYTNTVIDNAIHESEQGRISKITDQLASHIGLMMERASSDLKSLQTNPIVSDLNASPEARVNEMRRLRDANDSFTDISIYATNGRLIQSTTDKVLSYRDYTEWFNDALKGKTAVSIPSRSLGEDGLNLSVYLPIFDSDGVVQSVIMARQDFKRVSDLIFSATPGDGGKFVLLDHAGRVLSMSTQEKSSGEIFDANWSLESWGHASMGKYLAEDGQEFIYSTKVLQGDDTKTNSDWVLLSLLPISTVEQVLASSQFALLVTTLITLGIAVLLGVIISPAIARHVVKLNLTAQKVAAGNLDVKVEATGFKEVRELAESFNQMIAELKTHQTRLEYLVSKRTEKLRESEKNLQITSARLKAAFNGSKDGILVTGCDGRIVMNNPVFAEMLGLSGQEDLNMSDIELREHIISKISKKAEARQFLEQIMKPEQAFEMEMNLDHKGQGVDKYCVASLYSTPISDNQSAIGGRLWVLRDLTEKRLLEENLRQANKMEAIGTLAGGVAHDFNNLLTGIYGHLSLLDMENLGENHSENKNMLSRAIHATRRATDLVKQLLGFSRQSHLDLRPCSAVDIAEETRDFLTGSIDPNITIDSSGLDEQSWPVLADPSLLNQIIMNMSVNAIDAMNGKGTLKYSTFNCEVTPEHARMHPDAHPGDFLCITIEDDGEGIPESIQQKIFEPFFTTKEQGRGTGLGLATCFGIAKQMGGWITFESSVGVGTKFYTYLPRSKSEITPVEKEEAGAPIGKSKNETLLLVDDELVVRSVAEKLLTKLGYNIVVASNGVEAIEIFEKGEIHIDLVLLDMTMPKKSGGETFTELRDRFDYVPVLICSGYLVDLSNFECANGDVPDGFVQKPYQVENLAATVRSVIDRAVVQAA